MFLRNRFLNTTAFLLGPNDPPGGGGSDDDKQRQGNDGDGGQASGEDVGGAGDGAEGDGSGADGDDDGDDSAGADDDGDDDPLAGLDPEARAKAERAIARETGWRDRQLSRAHARARQAQEDAEAARQIVEGRGGKKEGEGGDQPRPLTQDEIRREAQKLTAQERYDEGCNQTDARGREYFGNEGWGKVTERLKNFGGVDQTDMVTILATDNPAVVLNELARNPEEYERVMSLPPAKRNNAFVKLGMKSPPKKAAATESKRPAEGGGAPPRVIQGRRSAATAGAVNLYDDKTDDAQWYAQRDKERRKKFSNAQ